MRCRQKPLEKSKVGIICTNTVIVSMERDWPLTSGCARRQTAGAGRPRVVCRRLRSVRDRRPVGGCWGDPSQEVHTCTRRPDHHRPPPLLLQQGAGQRQCSIALLICFCTLPIWPLASCLIIIFGARLSSSASMKHCQAFYDTALLPLCSNTIKRYLFCGMLLMIVILPY